MNTVRVNLGDRSYDIAITSGTLNEVGSFAQQRCRGSAVFLVGDDNVRPHVETAAQSLTAAGFRVVTALLPPGEAQKSLAAASTLYDQLVAMKADRRTLVAAVGGGVVGDLAGFIAATYNRGLPFLQIPTTLLAMVDSSVGGKVGINHPQGKNLIGAFHQPIGVWIDTSVLGTLPEREYRSGLAEVVKYGVILDPEFFIFQENHLEEIIARDAATVRHLIHRSCRLKADVVEKDEREVTGLRAILNYGHTFAHAFETVGGYGAWLHGEAVAAGMVCASRLAERRGLIEHAVTERQRELLVEFGLPTASRAIWPVDSLLAVMRNDKKAVDGQMRFVLPQRLGAAALFDDVAEDDVRTVLTANQN